MNRTIMFGQPTQVVLEQAIENKYVFSRARCDPFLYDMHMRQLLTLFYKEPHRFHEQLWKLKKTLAVSKNSLVFNLLSKAQNI